MMPMPRPALWDQIIFDREPLFSSKRPCRSTPPVVSNPPPQTFRLYAIAQWGRDLTTGLDSQCSRLVCSVAPNAYAPPITPPLFATYRDWITRFRFSSIGMTVKRVERAT